MLQKFLGVAATLCLFHSGFAQKDNKVTLPTAAIADTAKPKKAPSPLAEKTKSSKRSEGLFTTYQDTATGKVQLYIKKDQLGKEYIRILKRLDDS